MKLRKKSVGLLAAAFAATMLMSGCGQVKIGYIEGSRVMQEAPQVKSLVDEGNQKINEAREEAQKSLQDIAKEKKLDVVVDSEKEQPTALMGCVDVTDDVIAKLQ